MKFIIASLLLLFVLGMAETVQKSKACLSCTSTCVLMAPAGVNFPCYQGAPSDANFCYDTVMSNYKQGWISTVYSNNCRHLFYRIPCWSPTPHTPVELALNSDSPSTFKMTPSTRTWSCGWLQIRRTNRLDSAIVFVGQQILCILVSGYLSCAF